MLPLQAIELDAFRRQHKGHVLVAPARRQTELVEDPLYSEVWADPALSPRDRSIATVAAVVALYRPEELPAQLRRAVD
ncbi:carboxymuconolactone decarboxylase family protein [Streptomyces olivaceoviridis]|uniref:carboxymuconolactone decarboxylase family protein n=1 Tax=Streptomyces olivaceoviridis TaxID=1921 RepID=UPI00331FD496